MRLKLFVPFPNFFAERDRFCDINPALFSDSGDKMIISEIWIVCRISLGSQCELRICIRNTPYITCILSILSILTWRHSYLKRFGGQEFKGFRVYEGLTGFELDDYIEKLVDSRLDTIGMTNDKYEAYVRSQTIKVTTNNFERECWRLLPRNRRSNVI